MLSQSTDDSLPVLILNHLLTHRSDLEALREGLFCIGRFETRKEFGAAIQFAGDIHATLGPQGGFRGAEVKVCYDGSSMDGRLYQEDRDLRLEFLEPLAKRQKAKVQTTKLPSARRR